MKGYDKYVCFLKLILVKYEIISKYYENKYSDFIHIRDIYLM